MMEGGSILARIKHSGEADEIQGVDEDEKDIDLASLFVIWLVTFLLLGAICRTVCILRLDLLYLWLWF